jgi:hemerythrin
MRATANLPCGLSPPEGSDIPLSEKAFKPIRKHGKSRRKGATMDLFRWKETFNTGIEEVDRQHQLFLQLLNDAHANAVAAEPGSIDPALAAKIKAYAAMHFRYEESLMQSIALPDLERHQKEHRFFESQLETAFTRTDKKAAEGIFVLLRDWLLHHILEEDHHRLMK